MSIYFTCKCENKSLCFACWLQKKEKTYIIRFFLLKLYLTAKCLLTMSRYMVNFSLLQPQIGRGGLKMASDPIIRTPKFILK